MIFNFSLQEQIEPQKLFTSHSHYARIQSAEYNELKILNKDEKTKNKNKINK